jgi:hypothetical protein
MIPRHGREKIYMSLSHGWWCGRCDGYTDHTTDGHVFSDTEMCFPVYVYVKRTKGNDIHGEAWIPDSAAVAHEVKLYMVGRDMDTGWDIVDVQAGRPYEGFRVK